MHTLISSRCKDCLGGFVGRRAAELPRDGTAWVALPVAAQLYAAGVIAAGISLTVTRFPVELAQPLLFAALVAISCLTSAWKVTLPMSLRSGSTLSVSYAADLMALLLLGPDQAMLVAAAGVWTQCTFKVKQLYPAYRTIFSIAAEVITIQATGIVYAWLGGGAGLPQLADLPRVLVGAISAYFVVNTGLVAGAIALSTRQRAWKVWEQNFLWSAPSFMVAGAAGAIAAIVIRRGDHWLAVLMLAPVYLTYRTYEVFLGRIEDQRRHLEETEKLHGEAIEALLVARRADEALADEKERLAVTLRSIGDGVITTDLNGTITLLNNVAETLTGWTQEEALGRSLDAVFQNFDGETRERCDNSVATLSWHGGHPGLSRCTLLVARDLTERPIEELAAPLRDAAGRTIGMVLAFRDITDSLRVQEERANAGKAASLGLLAGGIAHDFNNILMAIMGNLSMAQATASTGSAARALAEAQEACGRATQLTWRLLTFSRGGVPSKKTMSVARIAKDSASLTLRGSHASCTFEIAPDLWTVSADEKQFAQVIDELVINAQQAMPHGGIVHIKAENVCEPGQRWENALRVEPGRYVRVSVTDHGIGIPEENIGRIFDPYFSTKQRASGLGLATSHSIIKHHGGFVSVRSKPGEGTTIGVNIPAAVSCELPVVEPIAAAACTSRILVMDDEPQIRRVAVNMLEFLGHDVEVVDNGIEAVERYTHALQSGRPFDAVMLDLVVPSGLGAREAMELISEVDPAVKAIVVSGYAQDPAVTQFQDHGFKACIAKPFTLQELNSALHCVMHTGPWRVH